MRILRDTWLMFERSMWLTLHNPMWIFIGIMQPFLYLALFGPLLKNIATLPGFPPGGTFNVFVPGLLIQLALFGVAFAGFGLLDELRAGVVERMRVTPMSRLSMLLGRALRDIVFLEIQAVVLMLVAVPFGLDIQPAAFLATLGLVALIGMVMAPLSYAMALKLRGEDSLAAVLNSLVVPLLLLSGVLLPMTLAPDWLRTLATIDPLSHIVDAARALFNAHYGDPAVLRGTLIIAILAALSVVAGARAFSSETA